MNILRRKQSNELVSLRDAMNRLVEDSFYLPQALLGTVTGEGSVLLDMYEENQNIVVKASLPGVKPEDVKIEIEGDVLTISGKTNEEVSRKEGDYLLNERRAGQVRRSVVLPYEVKADKAEAEFDNGILTLTLPKMETARAKKIALKPKAAAVKPAEKSAGE